MEAHHQNVTVIGISAAAARLSTTRQNLYEIHKTDPTFPRIFKVSPKKSAILSHELDAWITARHASTQIRPLAKGKGGAQ